MTKRSSLPKAQHLAPLAVLDEAGDAYRATWRAPCITRGTAGIRSAPRGVTSDSAIGARAQLRPRRRHQGPVGSQPQSPTEV